VTSTNSNSGEKKLCLHIIEPKQEFIDKYVPLLGKYIRIIKLSQNCILRQFYLYI
jgi:hypothetical protein